MSDPHQPADPPEDSFRPHVYDGIQEYNKRLPNWWLLTFYGTIIFSVGYWFYYAQSGIPPEDGVRVEQAMARIEAAKLAGQLTIDDATLWQMSRNPVFVDAGRATYQSTCLTCHTGPTGPGIGPDLFDGVWVHGSAPMVIQGVVDKGVLEKGMPGWGPILGSRKVAEVVAYVLSRYEPPAAPEAVAP